MILFIRKIDKKKEKKGKKATNNARLGSCLIEIVFFFSQPAYEVERAHDGQK